MELLTALKKEVIKYGCTLGHVDLPNFFQTLGMPASDEASTSKRDRIKASLSKVIPESVPNIAQSFIDNYCSHDPATRNMLQDLLWSGYNTPRILTRHRREIANIIGDEFYLDPQGFDRLLEKLWILEDLNGFPFILGTPPKTLRDHIAQHIHRNPGDWDAHKLFEELGAYDASDKRFCLFMEGLASGEVRPEESEQRKFVLALESILKSCGTNFIEEEGDDGYPAFKIVPTNVREHEKPKNIIFASTEKPDLRLSDAISNRIEVLTHQEKVLVYDQPISLTGLSWQQLQDWWKENNSISDDKEAKAKLYARLRTCLPSTSPPQKHFFEAYHTYYGKKIPTLPALLPEVWLYWDPKTIRERGINALKNLRMDFLLLLTGGVRVIVEIDGQQHYSNEDGTASPQQYAKLVSGDRNMQLLGYDVYRFGGSELRTEAQAKQIVGPFFDQLFKKYNILQSMPL